MSELRRTLPEEVTRLQLPALLVGVAALIACVIGLFFSGAKDFFLGWVLGLVMWTGLSVGCLAVLMMQYMTGGAWGLAIRRPLESAARMLPVMGLLFIPLFFGMHHLYEWSEHPIHGSEFQDWWLRPGFWIGRTIAYFIIWALITFFLQRWSLAEDETANPRLAKYMERLSAFGMVVYWVTITLAAIDWVMSMSPDWTSTIYGMIFIAGQGLFAFAAMILVLAGVWRVDGMREIVNRARFHELANLMLAFLLIWAYVSFSQFLLIWTGNIRDETPFYVYRMHNGLQWIGIFLIACGFFLPFFCLLSAKFKRSIKWITLLALGIVLMRFVDLYWLVVPSYSQGHEVTSGPLWQLHWQDILAPLGIGGVWIAIYIWQLGRYPLVPINDLRLLEVEEETHHG